MKNLLTAIFLIFSSLLFAQEKSFENRKSNEEIASLRAKSLTMQLDLSPEQEADLIQFYLKRLESRKERIQNSDQNKDYSSTDKASEYKRKENLRMSEEQKSELREILTAEQYLKWQQLQEKRRKGLKNPLREN